MFYFSIKKDPPNFCRQIIDPKNAKFTKNLKKYLKKKIIIPIIGQTNAGKSTLMNYLTDTSICRTSVNHETSMFFHIKFAKD